MELFNRKCIHCVTPVSNTNISLSFYTCIYYISCKFPVFSLVKERVPILVYHMAEGDNLVFHMAEGDNLVYHMA